MSLKRYREKREFESTPEPAGKKHPRSSGKLYVVQKHDARKLHYDFRLEMDGVLKSWAVPKGPSLDPAEKRLAVHVEDHPLEYGSFEGVIPEEEYGGGTVLLWDRGEWEPEGDAEEGYRSGKLTFRLHGEKLRGEWSLVRMKGKASNGGKNWLLVKARDREARSGKEADVLEESPRSVASGRNLEEIAEDTDPASPESPNNSSGAGKQDFNLVPASLTGSRRSELPSAVDPQLAESAEEPPEGDSWLHEIKYDGYRILCVHDGTDARLFSRNGKDWTGRFPDIARAAASLSGKAFVLDGEVAVRLPEGRTDFQSLQNLLKGTHEGRLFYFVFDVIHYDGWDLFRTPLEERKEFLRELMESQSGETPLRFADHIRGRGREVYEQSCRYGLDGIVSKKADSPYVEKRSRQWLKAKCLNRREFVIAGFTDPEGARSGFGALLLGYYDNEGRLIYSGRVGTGFGEREVKELHEKLEALETQAPAFFNPPQGRNRKGVHWTRPELVAEVVFSEWTDDGILRHPVFKGLREDKPASEVRLEKTSPGGESGQAEKSPGRSSAGRTASGRRRSHSSARQASRIGNVRVTHPDKVMFPDTGLTKEELARYYEAISPKILPHLADRPLTLLRCPDGRDRQCFYQRHYDASMPDAVRKITVSEDGEKASYPGIDDPEGLISLVQFGVLEFHPWSARLDKPERPDRLIFDLDPGPGVSAEELVEAAREVLDRLETLGLQAFVKTSGGKGFHVAAPLVRRAGWEETYKFAEALARDLAAGHRKRFVAHSKKSARQGRIYIDYVRNARAQTCVAPYSTRARRGTPISTPLRRDELEPSLAPDAYTAENIPKRLSALKRDPWEGFFDLRQSVTKAMRRELGLS